MNKSDSSSIENILIENSLEKTDDSSNADYVIINTCSVREHAENRVFARLSLFKSIKKKYNKEMKIIVTGCMVRNAKDKLVSLGADALFSVYEQDKIKDYINGKNYGENIFGADYNFKKSCLDEKHPYRSYIAVTHGCDNWCTYCIVPYTRGAMISRNSKDVLDEVKRISDKGAKEIILLGQNVNSYGKDNGDMNFVDLLYEIDKRVKGIWIRFLTSHPKDFTKELATAMLSLQSVCKHIHLPLQSGSDRILQIMGRKYTRDEYLEKLSFLRDTDENFAVTTDIIVGFADESESEFKQTLQMIETVGYEDAYMYKYSPRPNSLAYERKMPYSEEAAKERLKTAIDFQRNIAQKMLAKSVGTKTKVIVESDAKDGKNYITRSEEYRIVLVKKSDAYKKGSMIDVVIEGIKNHSLIGRVI